MMIMKNATPSLMGGGIAFSVDNSKELVYQATQAFYEICAFLQKENFSGAHT